MFPPLECMERFGLWMLVRIESFMTTCQKFTEDHCDTKNNYVCGQSNPFGRRYQVRDIKQ